MTVDIPYPPSLNKVIDAKARTLYKISINDRPILSLQLDKPQKGGQGLGKRHRIRRLYIDPQNRIFAEYSNKDGSGTFYQYVVIGRLHVIEGSEPV